MDKEILELIYRANVLGLKGLEVIGVLEPQTATEDYKLLSKKYEVLINGSDFDIRD